MSGKRQLINELTEVRAELEQEREAYFELLKTTQKFEAELAYVCEMGTYWQDDAFAHCADAVRWEKKAKELEAKLAEAQKTIYKRNGENVNLMAERDRQRETMEWYGDEENYLLHYAPETHYPIFDDGGKRARKALEGKEPG